MQARPIAVAVGGLVAITDGDREALTGAEPEGVDDLLASAPSVCPRTFPADLATY